MTKRFDSVALNRVMCKSTAVSGKMPDELSVMRSQALGALRGGRGHHLDQAEGGESLPQVPPAAAAADLRLGLL